LKKHKYRGGGRRKQKVVDMFVDRKKKSFWYGQTAKPGTKKGEKQKKGVSGKETKTILRGAGTCPTTVKNRHGGVKPLPSHEKEKRSPQKESSWKTENQRGAGG